MLVLVRDNIYLATDPVLSVYIRVYVFLISNNFHEKFWQTVTGTHSNYAERVRELTEHESTLKRELVTPHQRPRRIVLTQDRVVETKDVAQGFLLS